MQSASKNLRWSYRAPRFARRIRDRLKHILTSASLYRTTGRWGERLARRQLEKAGARILVTNWRSSRIEADLIILDGRTIAVVEVKTRHERLRERHPGIAAITPEKRQHLTSLLKRFMRNHGPLCRRFSVKRGRIDALEVYYMRSRFGFRKATALRWHTGIESR